VKEHPQACDSLKKSVYRSLLEAINKIESQIKPQTDNPQTTTPASNNSETEIPSPPIAKKPKKISDALTEIANSQPNNKNEKSTE